MVRHFKSKRNQVTGIGGLVFKRVGSGSLAEAEAARLRLLLAGGVKVPRVFFAAGRYIVMELVPAAPLTEWLEGDPSKEELLAAAGALAAWMAAFYRAAEHGRTGRILQDVNCRNFLVDGKLDIWGVDFEEFACGTIMENVARTAAYVNTCDILPDTREVFSRTFLSAACERFRLSPEEVLAAEGEERRLILQRRGQKKGCP